MQTLILCLLFVGVAKAASRRADETIKEFEEKFHVEVAGEGLEEVLAKRLEQAEEAINANNEKFEKGESTFLEKLYAESVMDKDTFKKDKMGLLNKKPKEELRKRRNGKGLIYVPESMRDHEKNAAALAKIDAMMDRAVPDDVNASVMDRAVPDSYNAYDEGLITEVKSQGSCGSCVAFASHGLHESCMIKAGASMEGLDLSEQYLIDCGYNGDSMKACNGASPEAYTQWFTTTGEGVSPHENTLPYEGSLGTCSDDVTKWNSGAKVTSNNVVYSPGANRMKKMVYKYGAVLAGLYADDTDFDNYASGIFQGCSSTSPSHAVLVVGYGTDEDGVDYWLVKNSWGTNWGESGYFKLARGSNECGLENYIAMVASCESTESEADEVPTTAAPPASSECDVSGLGFSITLNGGFTLYVTQNGVTYTSSVNCVDDVCTPKDGVDYTNACVYICGSETCG